MSEVIDLRSLAASVLAISCSMTFVQPSHAQGFSPEPAPPSNRMEDQPDVKARIGKIFWEYYGEPCKYKVDLTSAPNGHEIYSDTKPVQVLIEKYVANERGGAGSFRVLIDGKTTAYVRDDEFWNLADKERTTADNCASWVRPEERGALIAAQKASTDAQNAKLSAQQQEQRRQAELRAAQEQMPDVKIGMSTKEVLEQSKWGRPNSIRKMTTKNGTREMWLYLTGTLVFQDGKLAVIDDKGTI